MRLALPGYDVHRFLLLLVPFLATLGCQPNASQDIGPPYAFHVSIQHRGGVPDLDVFVTAESGDFYEPDVSPWWSAGRDVVTDIYWGGNEPEGSLGACRAFVWGVELEFELVAELGEDGRPITQHASGTVWLR